MKTTVSWCWLVAFLAVPAPLDAAPVGKADSLDRLLEILASVRTYRHVTLAPDGQHVAWVESLAANADDPATGCGIFIMNLAHPEAEPPRLTAGDGRATCTEHGVAWSPDGRSLAFLSDHARKGQVQVYVAELGGKARRLTSLSGHLADLSWSPDGKRLAVLCTEGVAADPTAPAAPEVGVIGESAPAQRLCLIDLVNGRLQTLSPPSLHVFEYDWAPDGKRLVASAAPPPGDDNWYIARLYTISTDSGALRRMLKPEMQIGMPRWSPDGQSIAFIGGLMSDEGVLGGDIWVVDASGGTLRNLTPRLRATASWLAWLSRPDRIVFAEHIEGGCGVAEVDPATGRLRSLWTGAESISGGGGSPGVSLSRDGTVAALVRQSFGQPPEIWTGPVGDWQQRTRGNRDHRPGWGEARSLHWKSDEWEVQGWLLYPRDFDPNKRYPLLVSVHGGPAASRRPAWPGTNFDLAVLAHAGYFVLFPNPRGSYGRGEAFTRANVKDFGHGDLRDILGGVDAALRVAPIDADRVGIAGWSYGGYMTMWAVTQSNRFKAAVAGAGVANWQSYYGQNGIDKWMLPYFGASVYDDPAVYARSSPIQYIKQVHTPTIVVVGERDAECPAPQSREYWHALKTLGVPTKLVIYPGEGHRIGQPAHRRDLLRRTAAWLDHYLRAADSGQR
jgi:dipeptidyl aminopeptidase/acylaminoacyl peptidase